MLIPQQVSDLMAYHWNDLLDRESVTEYKRLIASILVSHIHLLGQAEKWAVFCKFGIIATNVNGWVGLICLGLVNSEDYPRIGKYLIKCFHDISNNALFLPSEITGGCKGGSVKRPDDDWAVVGYVQFAIEIKINNLAFPWVDVRIDKFKIR